MLLLWCVDSRVQGKSPPVSLDASLPRTDVCPRNPTLIFTSGLLPLAGQRQRPRLHVSEPLGARVQSWVRPPAGKFSHCCHLPYRLSHKEGNKLWLVSEQRGGHSVIRLPQVADATVITECLSPHCWSVQHKLCLLSLCAILFGPGSEEVLLVTPDS